MRGRFLAVDWGTTNRRVYLMSGDGAVERTERDDRGILAVGPGGFKAEAALIRDRFGDLPMLCAGMVGSNRGWRNVPYVACPARFEDLTASVQWVEPGRTAIVPGLSLLTDGRADVMRGEEVQILGAATAALVPPDALLCHPGTHCKWAVLSHGQLTSFVTAMTGEMFALLKAHSLLSEMLGGSVNDDAAFDEGVDAARTPDLLSQLFGARAAVLLDRRSKEATASYISGVLIGSDVVAHATGHVYILAGAEMGCRYARAISLLGGTSELVEDQAAFTAGIAQIWSLIK